MAFLIGDSCIRDLLVQGLVVQSIGGLHASDKFDIDRSYQSVFLSVGGNDLAERRTPQQVCDALEKKAKEVFMDYNIYTSNNRNGINFSGEHAGAGRFHFGPSMALIFYSHSASIS